MLQYPLVSCICVTRKKTGLLARAIKCFLAQTYPNKELVILYEDDDKETGNYLQRRAPSPYLKIIIIPKNRRIKLGNLRNEAINSANGDYVCQWDDDDWYHSERLMRQYGEIAGTEYVGSLLTKWVVFDEKKRNAYLSNIRPWEGSIFCKKDVMLQEKYDNKSIGEDTSVIYNLLSKGLIKMIADNPWLYIYIYHGNNTWGRRHWKLIFKFGQALSDKDNGKVADICKEVYNVSEGSDLLKEIIDMKSVV